MELPKEKKKKLKDLLFSVSSESEREELEELELSQLNENMGEFSQSLQGKVEEMGKSVATLSQTVSKINSNSIKSTGQVSEHMQTLITAFTTKVDELKEVFKKSDPEILSVPLYKSMINEISGVQKAIVDKPTPVWRWPQYASVSVRNKNFANINPSVDLFNVGSSDDVILGYTGSNLTTVTYYLNGAVTAVLTLSYDGSSNLTQVQRTS